MKIVFDSEEQRKIIIRACADDDYAVCPSSLGLEESEHTKCGTDISCRKCWRNAIESISEVKPNDQG